jgi:UDP-N-acetylglucosamine 2-epimerase (non-hydrolysing)
MDFLVLVKKAALVLTDSGGVQEEACILHTPCVTLRDNTERPETLQVGSNRLAGTASEAIVRVAETMVKASTDWSIPFGDGKAADRIAKIVESVLEKGVDLADLSVSNRTLTSGSFSLQEV